jgi:H2-forming N5,N10-methylenetetrahydromethanopterin dehydrogenase-like enzyme
MEECSALGKYMNAPEYLIVQQCDLSLKTIAGMIDSGAIKMIILNQIYC